ncbi:MAG: hypothetical protein CMF38_04350 [Legionellaceae bacterium]|nr:hypothetical protein [Legionellaceae bacterium]HAF87176.1 hypothetical protein [Legionellales bacterium]HCA89168.1 hypothetical protein [Legionellales bacterium]
MKIHRQYWLAFCLFLSFDVFSLGLGDIHVASYLNQPFYATIPLLDAEKINLEGIRVALAPPGEYKRLGITINDALAPLRFEVKINAKQQPVIVIYSIKRMQEPVMEFILDTTWANGQFYRTYTVLLDPPDYGSTAQAMPFSRNDDSQPLTTKIKRLNKSSVIKPANTPESIWSVAQRYTTEKTTLAQTVLALVGRNPTAFKAGNLNGYNTDSALTIPSYDEIQTIPANLAAKEVQAHDKAWSTKNDIEHVINPPYFKPTSKIEDSNIKDQAFPSASSSIPTTSIPAATSSIPTLGHKSSYSPATQATSENKSNIEAQKLETLLKVSQQKNQALQQNIIKQAQAMQLLKANLNNLSKKYQTLSQQKITENSSNNSKNVTKHHGISGWIWFLIVLLMGGLIYLLWPRIMAVIPFSDEHEQLKDDEHDDHHARLSSMWSIPTEDETLPQVTSAATTTEVKSTPSVNSESKLEQQEETTQHADKVAPQVISTEDNAKPANNHDTDAVEQNTKHLPSAKATKHDAPDDKISAEPSSSAHTIDYEPDLTENLHNKNDLTPQKVAEDSTDLSESNLVEDNSIDFEPIDSIEPMQFNAVDDVEENEPLEFELAEDDKPSFDENEQDFATSADPEPEPIKSKAALDTLLELARTYISMEDFETARQSLDEVVTHGSESQKKTAQSLIEQLAKKS